MQITKESLTNQTYDRLLDLNAHVGDRNASVAIYMFENR